MDSHPNQGPPGQAAYQVNVNRTKTRKWVEARVQSYDGDDWGADEYSDPEPEPVPQPKQPAQQSPPVSDPSSGSPCRERRASAARPHIRPSDIYRRMEEDRQRERSADGSRTSVDAVTDDAGRARQGEPSLTPKLPDVARLSVFGPDLFSEGNGDGFKVPAALPAVAEARPASPQVEDAGEKQAGRPSPTAHPPGGLPAIPPLRTPSPRIPSVEGDGFGPAASPVKDNDALSDEILRSLSPAEHSGKKRSTVRDSSYTLTDYDSYWADSDRHEPAKPASAVPPVPAVPDGNMLAPESPESHRRFSWEIDEEEPDGPLHTGADEPHGTLLTGADAPRTPEASMAQAPAPEPPSPVSAVSDAQALAAGDSRRASLGSSLGKPPSLDKPSSLGKPSSLDKALSSLGSPTPPPEPTSSQAPSIMTFREILGMASPADRIAKYNETRDYFASSESGLEAWMAGLQARHPEHIGGHTARPPAAAQGPAQPYQHLSANSPSSGASPSSRSRPGQTASPAATFGHSNQLGIKSKELMHSAGKMGKGLLSKGKNKLRGSGDKGELRTSWAGGPAAPDMRSAPPEKGPALPETGMRPAPPTLFAQHPGPPLRPPGSAARATAGLRRLEIPASGLEGGVRADWEQRPDERAPDGGVPLQPKRSSSFVGLPPIRRSSTFGLTKAKRASQRFSLDDPDAGEPAQPQPALPPSSVQPTPVDAEADVPEDQPPRWSPAALPLVYCPAAWPPMLSQARLATGPWKPQESRLTEPLHLRHRPGTAGSPRVYDKETGVSPTTPTYQRTSDMPPSSAQRHAWLFAPPPGYDGQLTPGQLTSPGKPLPYHAPLPRTESSEFELAGVGPPEERGRSRRSSGILRDVGSRIARAASRERFSRPATADGGGSEPSTPDLQRRGRRRSGFLFAAERLGHAQSKTDLRQHDRRTSLGAGIGAKLVPGRPSTAGLDSADRAPKKKRFSNIAGIKYMFHRPDHDKVHGAPSGSVHGLGISTLDPPRPPFAEGSERRGRRGSVSSLLSGFLGHRSSKTREGDIRPGQQSQQQLVASHGFVPPRLHPPDVQAARSRAASVDARVPLTIRPVSQVPRPSPLGSETPLAGRVHARKLSEGIGAQHGGAELPRTSTVSPALSVTSDGAGGCGSTGCLMRCRSTGRRASPGPGGSPACRATRRTTAEGPGRGRSRGTRPADWSRCLLRRAVSPVRGAPGRRGPDGRA